MKEPGLDNRHRTQRGLIEQKHGNTTLRTLRKKHPDLLPGRRDDLHLATLLDEYRVDSQNALLGALGKR